MRTKRYSAEVVSVRVSVDNAVCEGHGQCFMADEELFPLDDEGYSSIGQGKEVPADQEWLAEMGIEACPAHALRVDQA